MKRAFDQRAPCPCPWSATAFMPHPVAGAAGAGMRPPPPPTKKTPPQPNTPPPPAPPGGGAGGGGVRPPGSKKRGGGGAGGPRPHRCACRDLTVAMGVGDHGTAATQHDMDMGLVAEPLDQF